MPQWKALNAVSPLVSPRTSVCSSNRCCVQTGSLCFYCERNCREAGNCGQLHHYGQASRLAVCGHDVHGRCRLTRRTRRLCGCCPQRSHPSATRPHPPPPQRPVIEAGDRALALLGRCFVRDPLPPPHRPSSSFPGSFHRGHMGLDIPFLFPSDTPRLWGGRAGDGGGVGGGTVARAHGRA